MLYVQFLYFLCKFWFFFSLKKKSREIKESFLIGKKNRFLKFVFGFSDWMSYPLIVLLPLAYPCKKKPPFFKFQIFLV